MLDYHLSATVTDALWHGIHHRAELPCGAEDYFAVTGATPTSPDSRRRFRRVRVRGRAAVRWGSELLGVYTIDVSPAGIGFFSPIQLFPKERVTIMIEECDPKELVIRRCRRGGKACYACGGEFTGGSLGPGPYRELLHLLKAHDSR